MGPGFEPRRAHWDFNRLHASFCAAYSRGSTGEATRPTSPPCTVSLWSPRARAGTLPSEPFIFAAPRLPRTHLLHCRLPDHASPADRMLSYVMGFRWSRVWRRASEGMHGSICAGVPPGTETWPVAPRLWLVNATSERTPPSPDRRATAATSRSGRRLSARGAASVATSRLAPYAS